MKIFKQAFLFIALVMLIANVGLGQISESFETGLPTSYTSTTTYTLNSGTWSGQGNGIIRGTVGVNSGSYSCQIRSQTGAQITTPTLTGGVGTISFYVTASTTSGAYQVNVSTDDGTTWSPASGSPFTISTTKTLRTIAVNNSNVNKVQIYRTGATIYIDDFSTTSSTTPTLSVVPGSLTGFTYVQGSGPSDEQTFTISGSNLTNNISIAAPTNYEISTTSGSGYTTPITLTQTGGSVSSTTIFVRLKSGLTQGDYNEVITASSTGASNKTVTCSGTVTSPPPPSAPLAITATNITSSSFTANWNAVADATSYRLDVMTSLGTANNLIQEGFESTTFAPTGWITTGWTRSTAAADIKNGIAATICGSNNGTLTTSAVSNPTTLSFYLGRSSNTTAKTLTIEVSTTNQTTGFSTVATFDHSNVPVSSYNQYTVDLSAYSSNSTVYVRFNKSSSTTSPWRLDDVLITNYSSPVYVSGYENKTVNGISDNVTGLNSGIEYYYRVRAVNSYGTSSNSNIITTTTLAGSNISVSPSSLSGFSYVFNSGPSVSQSFNASGTGLTEDITVTGTTNYEVSLTNSAFFNSVTLQQTGGVVNSTPVYVRLKSGLSIGNYNGENVTLSSTGVTTQSVSCNGSVIASAQVIYWDGGASTSNWNDAANWSNNTVPTTTNEVVLDNTNVSGNYSVDIRVNNVAIKKLSIVPTSGNTITLTLTSANTGTPGLQVGDNTVGTDDIIIGNGGILLNQSGATTASPLALIPETNGGTFRINNGGQYIHKTERRHADLVSALSTAEGTETGIFEFDVPITSSYFVALNGRTFGTLRFKNSTSYNYSASGVSTGPTIRGNLEFENYNGGTGIFNSENAFTFNINGNLINNGSDISFSNQNIIFNGNSEQNISGTGNITFSNLLLDNNDGVTLNRNIAISNSLTLTNGILNTISNNISFTSTATSPVETATNYILGNAVMQSRDLGVNGISDFLGLSISSGAGNVNGLTFARNTGTAKNFGTNQSINCSWDITGTITAERQLTLKWYDTFDNGKVFNEGNHGQLWKSVDNGTTWTLQGNSVNVSQNNPRTISTNVSSFSIWTASDVDAPLPVKLASFNSSVKVREIKLSWATSEEINNSGFDIERKSLNSDWQKVVFVNGNNKPSSYEYTDKNLTTGKYQYRLKQIDYNGNFEYHTLDGIVEVGVPAKFDLSQNYPNPFNPVTKINFDLPKAGQVSLKVLDILGKEVKTLVNEFKDAGYYNITFDASGLPSGVYFYRISAGEFTNVKKLVLLK